jgi:hypothetical protein
MESIGRYRIERIVSEGGLSTVYAGLDPLNRRVAIKLAKTSSDSPDHAWVLDRFQREAKLAAQLKHPAIVPVVDVGILPNGSPYLVSEWVEGPSLGQLLQSYHLIPLSIALSVAEQVAGALGAAHSLGFVHSDVKPANILIQDLNPSFPWAVKLLDFGVAGKLLEQNRLTRPGMLVGTPYYMSPEQILAGALSPSSDIWALGAVLFEMLTGRRLFGEAETFPLLSAIVNTDVKIPEDASLPAPVVAFLVRCLDKDPKLRPANGDEAAKEIRKLLVGLAPEMNRLPGEMARPSSVARTVSTEPTLAVSGAMRMFVAAMALTALAGVPLYLLRHSRPARSPWAGIALGVFVALVGTLLGCAIEKLLASRRRTISADVQNLLNGARTRRHLSETLAIQVDELVSKCRLVDEKILGTTMAVMVEEFGAASIFDDRQKALMNAIVLLEKLTPKLSPWYVRHDKLIGFLVTLVGLLSGLATVAQNIAKLIRGS